MLKILFIAISLFSSSAMAFKPGTGIIEKNWVACDDMSTIVEAIMLLSTNLDDFNVFMDKNGAGCYAMTQRGSVKMIREIGEFIEFKMDGIDKNLFALKSGFSR